MTFFKKMRRPQFEYVIIIRRAAGGRNFVLCGLGCFYDLGFEQVATMSQKKSKKVKIGQNRSK